MNGENPEIGSEKVKALLETMDEVIEVPERDNNLPFSVSIEQSYNIGGRGTVVTGTIDSGTIKVGEDVELVGYGKRLKSTITGIETFRK